MLQIDFSKMRSTVNAIRPEAREEGVNKRDADSEQSQSNGENFLGAS